MEAKKNRIVVLSDLNRSTYATLKCALSLARIIDGEIELFHVKKPTEAVKTDNQFSALRSMKDEYCNTEKEILEIIGAISNEYGTHITHHTTIGNVKKEIQNYLRTHSPDMIVIGKRPAKLFHLAGDGITEFVINNFEGTILVAADENGLVPDGPLSIGLLNGIRPSTSNGFSKELLMHSDKPLKAFTIIDKTRSVLNKSKTNNSEEVEFVFEKDENTVRNLSKYLLKNSINLLCVGRNSNSKGDLVNIAGTDIKSTLRKLEVSLLFTGKQNYTVS